MHVLARAPSPERVLLHTKAVPPNFLQVLGKVWTLRQVDYIEGMESLYSCKGTTFDGVFTKLAAWRLIGYDKVLLLAIDTVGACMSWPGMKIDAHVHVQFRTCMQSYIHVCTFS